MAVAAPAVARGRHVSVSRQTCRRSSTHEHERSLNFTSNRWGGLKASTTLKLNETPQTLFVYSQKIAPFLLLGYRHYHNTNLTEAKLYCLSWQG